MIFATMKRTHAAILGHTIEHILSQIQSSKQPIPQTTRASKPKPLSKPKPRPTHQAHPTQPKLQSSPIQQPSPANPLTSLPLIQPPPHPNLVIWKPKSFRLKQWLQRLEKRGKKPTYIKQQQPTKTPTSPANTPQQSPPPIPPPPPKVITLIEILQELWKQPTNTHKVQPPLLGTQSSEHQSRSHIPLQSRPRSQLTYGLCWHLALLVKAMATAWDLITQTDLWSSQL